MNLERAREEAARKMLLHSIDKFTSLRGGLAAHIAAWNNSALFSDVTGSSASDVGWNIVKRWCRPMLFKTPDEIENWRKFSSHFQQDLIIFLGRVVFVAELDNHPDMFKAVTLELKSRYRPLPSSLFKPLIDPEKTKEMSYEQLRDLERAYVLLSE